MTHTESTPKISKQLKFALLGQLSTWITLVAIWKATENPLLGFSAGVALIALRFFMLETAELIKTKG